MPTVGTVKNIPGKLETPDEGYRSYGIEMMFKWLLVQRLNLSSSLTIFKSEFRDGKEGDYDNKTDGNGTGSNTSSGNVPAQNCRPSRKKETAPRAAKTRLKVDKVFL